MNVKIADFGHSERDYFEVETSQEVARVLPVCKNNKQPICWVAYEVLHSKTKLYESDLWSFGVFMWEVFQIGKGKPITFFKIFFSAIFLFSLFLGKPYEFLRDDKGKINPGDILDFLNQGSRLAAPDHCPPEVYDLMLQCWKQEPFERSSFRHLKMELESLAVILDQERKRRNSVSSGISYQDRAQLNTQTSYVSMIIPQSANNNNAPPPAHFNLTYAALNANDEDEIENFGIL